MAEKVDALVVGAGPAGSAAAYTLAKEGYQVVLIERGRVPGEKNVSGGILFGHALHRLIPNYWEDAPIERFITSHQLKILEGDSSITVGFSKKGFAKPPFNGVSVIRYKFDDWFSKRAEEAGALLATGVRVDGLIWDNYRVVGVKAGEDELRADVVIAADGINSLLAAEANLRTPHRPELLGLGIKEAIKLPRSVIEERFNLSGDEGSAISFLGCTKGFPGGGFVYTNKKSLSIGVVVHLSAFESGKLKSSDLVEDFKVYPDVERLVRDGRVVEYSAHLVPEGGFGGISKLITDGLIVAGDAAGFGLNIGYSIEGMNFAIASGNAAAETVMEAKRRGDFSIRTLKKYTEILHRDFVLQDLRTFRRAPALLRNPNLYKIYPSIVASIAEELLTSKGTSRRRFLNVALHHWRKQASLLTLIKDGIQVMRAI